MIKTLDAEEVCLDVVNIDNISENENRKSVSGVKENEVNRKNLDGLYEFRKLPSDMTNEPSNMLRKCIDTMNYEQDSVQMQIGSQDADAVLLNAVEIDEIPELKLINCVSWDGGLRLLRITERNLNAGLI